MLNVQLDQAQRIAVLTPDGPLSKEDFENAARQIDPLIEQAGNLAGLIIHVEKFPGWDSFAGLSSHLRFVKDHHRHVKRIAFVTDSALGDAAETIASHFVAAEVKHFPYAGLDEAKAWILQP